MSKDLSSEMDVLYQMTHDLSNELHYVLSDSGDQDFIYRHNRIQCMRQCLRDRRGKLC